ncbi:hypothetical protein LTR78_000182 [Recurvomyces mirabilis]|uniref:Polyketide cyclase/dehydrase n=1 Tax=Recurvomyces mirabilis TaxID=574656 RepID=A0AAE1C6C7_9PEZI|nr:hypothetical protein LTR78_000182 [Recurvomyces mirabilis]KAK5161839.1 hypothetical protein LTS14_000184 [Recurvomyces mirabilis]
MSFLTNASIEVPITINAPPATVRKVLLDFARWPEWKNKQNIINHLHVKTSDDSTVLVQDAQAGDVMYIDSVQSGAVTAEVYVNNEQTFGYIGKAYGFTARHSWVMQPGAADAETTLFKHCEQFSGPTAWAFGYCSPLRPWIRGLFAAFNEDLKAAVESGKFC